MNDKIGQVIKFVKETRAETKKVVWPNRRHVAVATVIILVLVFIIGIYVMFIDFAFTRIFGFLMR